MAERPLRVGLVGAGDNTRRRHIPGLRAQPGVELVAVCNRRPESTQTVARDFAIPRTFARWQDLVADPDVDAVVVGTWPYLHRPITLAALAAGKHVLTEARMALDAVEARTMLAASRANPQLVCQIVPSPFGLKGGRVVRELLDAGYLGPLRQVQVTGLNAALADASAPLHWRQDATLSGFNMLILGILHETLLRWVPRPTRVLAQTHSVIPERVDSVSGLCRPVGTPDTVQVLAELTGGAQAVYHLGGTLLFGQEQSITLYGGDGVLHYDLAADRLFGASRSTGASSARREEMQEIAIPPEKAGGWRVEADFVESIREGKPVTLTDFATGVLYMEFTEAVALSAASGSAVRLL